MAPSPPSVPAPSATKGFTNSLGMDFVPVPGTQVQFCVHETRVADFAAFVADSASFDYSAGTEPYTADTDGWQQRCGFSWKKPGFTQTDAHPVTCVSWEDARAFCSWLSRKEGKTYRLPTDHEWSVAVGIGRNEDASASPESKDGKVEAVYPWGGDFPPSTPVGNYGGEDMKIGKEPSSWSVISGYRDGHSRTAPVMSFSANKLGIYDLGGNLWEWCDEWYDAEEEYRVLRGGSWNSLQSSSSSSMHSGKSGHMTE
jgi:formylglycine-generating enzyme required for sulfatase activity